MGASSYRIISQLAVESFLLAGAGCALGLGLAALAMELLPKLLAGITPQAIRPELDFDVMAFSTLASCGCAVLFGLLPALRAGRQDLNLALKESERGSQSASKRRSQAALIAAEFAFTLVLLIACGLFLRSFARLVETDPCFNPSQALAFDLSFSKAKFPKAEEQQRFFAAVHQRLAALPGVESVGAVTILPLSNRDNGDVLWRGDRETDSMTVANVYASGDYFAAMGISLFRDENPFGRPLRMHGQMWEVVGAVEPVSLRAAPRARVYGARGQASYPASTLVVRSTLPMAALVETVCKSVLAVDPDQPIANVRTLQEAVDKSVARERSTVVLLGLFASLAIGLACIGINGVVSYAVQQRSRELGIRAALGASRGDIVRLVLSGGLRLALLGIATGLAVASLLAIWIPARRASRLNPIVALRND